MKHILLIAILLSVNVSAEALKIDCIDGRFTSYGSGFAIKENVIVTCAHNVDEGKPFIDGVECKILCVNKERDIAFIQTTKKYKVGKVLIDTGILAVGRDGKEEVTNKKVTLKLGMLREEIPEGNSGGPILNKDGLIIGMAKECWRGHGTMFITIGFILETYDETLGGAGERPKPAEKKERINSSF